jgi:hypothetical protein
MLSNRLPLLFTIVLLASAAPPAAPSSSPAARSQTASPAPAASGDVYRRMVGLNAGLRTYEARMRVDINLKTFPYFSPTLNGNLYFKQPDKQAVVFDTAPILAAQFKKVYPRVESPVRWPQIYDFSRYGGDAQTTTFRLVPKKNGRIDHLDAVVDNATATIKSYTWTYKDGGFITLNQTFATVNGNYLVKEQRGRIEVPSYRADVSSAFSGYKLNGSIDDGVFSGSS